MKKKELIRKISEEFELDEIKVSEYFENIFDTLAVAFVKNKNVNIGEFGKFRLKTKPDEEGGKHKTVLFSPVRKFASEINYNFNELSPLVIRVLDDKEGKEKVIDEYLEEEVGDVLLIGFEEEEIPEKEKEEVLIPEESKQEINTEEETEKQEEEILIHEGVKPEIPLEKETEKTVEEVLIPEETKQEVLAEEIPMEEKEEEVEEEILIPEEKAHEISDEIIPEEITEESKEKAAPIEFNAEEIRIEEEIENLYNEQDRIFDELAEIRIPEMKFEAFEEKVEIPEVIPEEEEIVSEVVQAEKPEEEAGIPDLKETEKKEEKIEDIAEPEILNENVETETVETFDEAVEEEIPEPPKSNLELEAELLTMLEERKKILEEIRKLEEAEEDDIIDIDKPHEITYEEDKNLFEENTLGISKQNVFVDENGKVLENLLKGLEDLEEEQKEKEDIIKETPEEHHIKDEAEQEPKDEKIEEAEEEITGDLLKETAEEETKEEIKGGEKPVEEIKETEPVENIEEIESTVDKEVGDLENLLSSMYDDEGGKTIHAEPEESQLQMNNPEMKVFDKLLDESGKDNLVPPKEPENEFVTFKTKKTEGEEEEDGKTPSVKKTETIKTYDDIFNLIEPNGKKKEQKPVKIEEAAAKKFPPILKLIIPVVALIILIFISVYLYQRSVYKTPEETTQTGLAPADSTKSSGSDSVIYADTNKTEEAVEEDVVFDEDGYVIKENDEGFFIHFGNFENQFELAKKIKELKDKNIPVNYEEVTVEGKQVYKMIAGPYKSLERAKKIIPKL